MIKINRLVEKAIPLVDSMVLSGDGDCVRFSAHNLIIRYYPLHHEISQMFLGELEVSEYIRKDVDSGDVRNLLNLLSTKSNEFFMSQVDMIK